MPKYVCTHPGCAKTFPTAQARGAHCFASHVRQRRLKAIAHGTKAGYLAHRRRDDPPCVDCRQAWRDYYEQKRSSS